MDGCHWRSLSDFLLTPSVDRMEVSMSFTIDIERSGKEVTFRVLPDPDGKDPVESLTIEDPTALDALAYIVLAYNECHLAGADVPDYMERLVSLTGDLGSSWLRTWARHISEGGDSEKYLSEF